MVFLALAGLALALPPPPAPLALSAADEARVTAGEILVWSSSEDGGLTMGVVDVKAPARVVMEEVMNLEARTREIGGLQSLEVYLREPGRTGARWSGGLSLISATFHVLYEYDLDQGYCTFDLDRSRVNEVSGASGSYQVYPLAQGSRMVYRTVANTGGSTPAWARRRFAETSARELLGGIKARSEAR